MLVNFLQWCTVNPYTADSSLVATVISLTQTFSLYPFWRYPAPYMYSRNTHTFLVGS